MSAKSARNVASSAASLEAVSDEARTDTIATRPSPIMRADGGRGGPSRVPHGVLPAELALDRQAAMGRPSAPATGFAASGDSMAMPTNVTAAPRPTSAAAFDGVPNRP